MSEPCIVMIPEQWEEIPDTLKGEDCGVRWALFNRPAQRGPVRMRVLVAVLAANVADALKDDMGLP